MTSFFRRLAGRAQLRIVLRRGKIRVELLQDLVARPLDIDFETLQDPGGDAFAFAQKTEQDVLGADVGMIESAGLFAGQREHLLDPRRVGNVADHFGFRAGADLFLDLHAHGLEIEAHLLEDVDRDALAELDQPEQEMLGADVIVVEAVGFFASQRENLLRPRSEVIHCD